jgi:hypothetical protein
LTHCSRLIEGDEDDSDDSDGEGGDDNNKSSGGNGGDSGGGGGGGVDTSHAEGIALLSTLSGTKSPTPTTSTSTSTSIAASAAAAMVSSPPPHGMLDESAASCLSFFSSPASHLSAQSRSHSHGRGGGGAISPFATSVSPFPSSLTADANRRSAQKMKIDTTYIDGEEDCYA